MSGLAVASPAAWLQLVLGAAILLWPGVALATRFGRPLLGPVFSFTVLPLAVILADLVGIPVTAPATVLFAAGIGMAASAPTIVRHLTARDAGMHGPQETERTPTTARWWPLLVILPLVALVHHGPHLWGDPDEGDGSASPLTAYVDLARAVADEDKPYPVHVDEHIHHAFIAQLDRQQEIDIDDPYTGRPSSTELFSVQGMRSERGFTVAMWQASELTGVDVPTMQRFLPALWAAYLAAVLYATLHPARGALASAALVMMLPTTLRFLGIGFLIPSNFGLVWILATLMVALRAEGPKRFAGLVLLVTGAHFMHLVIGVLCILVGLLATAIRPGHPADRLGVAAGVLVPLVWIVPTAYQDIVTAVSSQHTLPFATEIYATPGLPIYALALLGAVMAIMVPRREEEPHRVLIGLAVVLVTLMAWSVYVGHRNEATYARLVHAFFLVVASLAGLGLGHLTTRLGRLRTTVVPLVLVVVLAFPLHAHLNESYYRVFDEEGWQDVEAFAASGAGPGDVFLAHPWRAPVLSAVTGATPYAVLRPGNEPVNDDDYVHYLTTNGSSEAWLQARGIDWVVNPISPNAPNTTVGARVHRL